LLISRESKIVWSDNLLSQSYIHLARKQWSAKQDAEALKSAQAALALAPKDLVSLFNVGVIDWYLSTQAGTVDTGNNAAWRTRLRMFEKSAAANKNLSLSLVYMVQKILNGNYKQKPPLLHPKEPSPLLKEKVDEIRKNLKVSE